MHKLKKVLTTKFTCPFCNESINNSSKTDILYRNQWIKGCYSCFVLSIEKTSMMTFQEKNVTV